MSLLQEALRRRSEETGRLIKLPLPPPPPPASQRWARIWLVVGLVIIVTLAVGLIEWYVVRPSAKVAAPSPITPLATVPPQAPAKTNLVAQAKAKLETTLTSERLELVMGVTNPPPKLAAPTNPPPPASHVVAMPLPAPAVNAVPVVATPSPVPAVNTVPVVAKPPPPVAIPVHWPKLNVTGIIGRQGGRTLAFVNGQMLKTGDIIEGARIMTIAENGIQLVFQGETNFVSVGKSIE